MAAETLPSPREPLKPSRGTWRMPLAVSADAVLDRLAETLRSDVPLTREDRVAMAEAIDFVRSHPTLSERARRHQWKLLVERTEKEIGLAKLLRDRAIPEVRDQIARREGFASGEALAQAIKRSKQNGGRPPARFNPR